MADRASDPAGVEALALATERAQDTIVGFLPETLCGLALAGANHGSNGRLTAEELATLDLTNCELAVLSACETNVGIRRAGQGIQSLQTALHAAGARTAITSLWKVSDAATMRLFELFYTKLWSEKLGPADALWQAKMALRAEGHPTRDWAGWVLTGDPE
jgi:CHAT domain-containing protein